LFLRAAQHFACGVLVFSGLKNESTYISVCISNEDNNVENKQNMIFNQQKNIHIFSNRIKRSNKQIVFGYINVI
jgi:hypothetical protein